MIFAEDRARFYPNLILRSAIDATHVSLLTAAMHFYAQISFTTINIRAGANIRTRVTRATLKAALRFNLHHTLARPLRDTIVTRR